jgi:hypothetical protein
MRRRVSTRYELRCSSCGGAWSEQGGCCLRPQEDLLAVQRYVDPVTYLRRVRVLAPSGDLLTAWAEGLSV